ncbi:ATPase, partial [Paenibacillus sepulcri]|nr:ATPase [Paenibacillus sepulcri]
MEQGKWHQMGTDELAQSFQGSLETGLTPEEAADRLSRFGRKELTEGKKASPWKLFFGQFKDFMVLVLIGATLISGLLGEYLDAITIVAIIVINAVLGFVQEYRAEKSLRALKALSAPAAKVMRGSTVIV